MSNQLMTHKSSSKWRIPTIMINQVCVRIDEVNGNSEIVLSK